MDSVIFGYVFIFIARVMDMSLDVIRILMLTRDKKLLAAAIGFVEIIIFVVALNMVMANGLDDPWKIIAYAGGFATGNYVGAMVENYLAVGFVSLQIFPRRAKTGEAINRLRAEGFGVTSVVGTGRSGPRTILYVIVKRKDLIKVQNVLDQIDPKIFYNISDARSIRGGVFPGKA
ncbi:DUF2179 domain-containing protein [Desulfofalx alkaliphila]|uniref:DUF2179 domain-containing protein n=1 Tax=Desulfofalx alkaliphila TaxID=105483 RepID=UPI000B0FE6A9|nr:DUF5698 domain-containing protein [Desulfofalx alkaliphila]